MHTYSADMTMVDAENSNWNFGDFEQFAADLTESLQLITGKMDNLATKLDSLETGPTNEELERWTLINIRNY